MSPAAASALSRNLKRGYNSLEGRSFEEGDDGEVARDAILTRVEAHIAALRETDPLAASEAEQRAKQLRVGRERQFARWWISRTKMSVETLLEGL